MATFVFDIIFYRTVFMYITIFFRIQDFFESGKTPILPVVPSQFLAPC